ncbi:MAG TPA: bifunctional oligoribonuclease/PAP phosphatase NrnA [Gordonia polyisoprenivorans]|uniref:Bifunctional oligoribonuclease/PAP phosphatase NrnA n=1 Tax=Gordonia polyisoprenivorans TaxID=84595 RepID=A0A846WMW4_9ACTN|nr:bifunctional oligoribonuclease/PAP phosphatase NrnA [Gordonia polyisoprenivorans]MBE7195053.1 bifunctional oligoribonuclease/PAP phosphatase NrnA [Gordonia polyisoprenivorans]NKY02699.1 bifunctional oligoribonuclease/PAP phosphatase NrnA [Gordonia polyisoprenivorans]OZC30224.1 bifunctional oligoribonuclease/PAP phosphatase NrnA [Gordonia polyisoprenivorans]QUD85382.1 bifunctional oligoribonuclease/PAP phosphatase NrnA [Gordonia polyisoprenivorans]UZF58546.1 bifunctional oligoribonuclease/PA
MTAASSAAIAQTIRRVADDEGPVTILCHVRPDADTIGSGLALGLALDRLGVDVEVAHPGPESLPVAFADLPGHKLLVDSAALRGSRLVVSVDAASRTRLGELESLFADAETTVVIDHHASNPGFGDLDFVDPHADCTAVLVLRVLDDLGVDLDEDIATCLYAGLITDTGSFRWARPESFRVAARLADAGVDSRTWSRRLLDTHPFGWLGMVSEILATATLDRTACGGEGLVYAVVNHRALAGMSWEESESVIDIVRTTAEAEVAAVFKEIDAGEWTVSLRSKSTVDLVPIARTHGGGGHRHASGYSDSGTADEVIGRLRQSL